MYYHSSIDNSWLLLITWITLFFRVFKYVLSKLIRIIEVIRFFFFNSTHFYKLISRLNSITLICIKLDPYRSQALQLVCMYEDIPSSDNRGHHPQVSHHKPTLFLNVQYFLMIRHDSSRQKQQWFLLVIITCPSSFFIEQ
jgi:hypothetical protein